MPSKEFLKTLGGFMLIGAIVLSVIVCHFFQVGDMDGQFAQVFGATTLAYALSLLLKVIALMWQFFVSVVVISQILIALNLAKATDRGLAGGVASVIIIGYVFVLVTYTILNIFLTKPDMVFVSNTYWQVNRHIEVYQKVAGEDWKDDVPSDAYEVGCESRKDLLKDKYRDYCTYSVSRWVTVSNMITTGGWQDKPYVQEYKGKVCSPDEIYLGCIRGTTIEKTWTTQFRNYKNLFGGDPFTCSYDFETWSKLPKGMYADMQFGVLDGTPRCRVSDFRFGAFDNTILYPYPEMKDFAAAN